MRITTNSKQQKGGFLMEQIAIFCDVDDFCKAYEEYCRRYVTIKLDTIQTKYNKNKGECQKWEQEDSMMKNSRWRQ